MNLNHQKKIFHGILNACLNLKNVIFNKTRSKHKTWFYCKTQLKQHVFKKFVYEILAYVLVNVTKMGNC